VVSRVCLTMLDARKRRREEALEAGRLPDPVITRADDAAPDPEGEALAADAVGAALLVVLETLPPPERLAFVLHDMFAVPFEDIAPIVDRSPAAARQLASRARRRVQGADRDAPTADREVVDAFLAAARGGDLSALVSLLDDEVVLTSDPQATPAGRPGRLRGPAVVARGAVASSVRAGVSQLALVDGSVGVVYAPAGRLQIVLTFTVSTTTRKISAIDVIADPGRLRRLRLAVLPD
jgi:RNA polymerase sigma-70 factor (ECF subfamily)